MKKVLSEKLSFTYNKGIEMLLDFYKESVFSVLWNPMRIRNEELDKDLIDLIHISYADGLSPIECAIIIRDLKIN